MNPLRIAEQLRTDYLQLLTTTFAPRQERLKHDFRAARRAAAEALARKDSSVCGRFSGFIASKLRDRGIDLARERLPS